MSQQKTVLIVDDDVDLLENTAFMVKSMGHDVFTAKDGDEAIVKYMDIKPNITFLDIRMPKMDGYDAFFKIKQLDAHAKVVLMTAYNQDERKFLKAKSMGLLDALNKPYSFDAIEMLINKY
ncbi:response regulator [Candidatus Nitrosotenuis cloacae]|uniref:response regulator n=1 Tax=Candidatus Nitrosotenuis cloacae TaxID=1603555 RepID=UPI002282DC03|nr:response regulator [Candidatus Nitrosotenuis cloacae]